MKHIILLLFAVACAVSVSAQQMPYTMVVRDSLVVGDTIQPEIPPRYPGGINAFNDYLYKVAGNNMLNSGIERNTVLRNNSIYHHGIRRGLRRLRKGWRGQRLVASCY